MIISCDKCKKKFNVEDDLIPKKGRYLQSSSCSHKWFFKKEKTITSKKIESKHGDIKLKEENINEIIPSDVEKISTDAESFNHNNKKKKKNYKIKKNANFFNIFLVTIITFISLIIILDTFKNQIENLIPGFNFFLSNFYETLKDLILFFKDLIN
jgi:predicted Zn finger-like uncharacterized protein